MERPKSEDYQWGVQFKKANIEFMDFAEIEIKRLRDKNEELIQARDYFVSLCIENGLISKT